MVENIVSKEKLLVISNFSFSHNVFHSYISLVCQNEALCGNGLKGMQKDLLNNMPRVEYILEGG